MLQIYVHIGLKQNFLRSTTLDIINTRLLDNAAFVCIHVVGRCCKDFSEVQVEFQLQVEWMTTVPCAESLKKMIKHDYTSFHNSACRFFYSVDGKSYDPF